MPISAAAISQTTSKHTVAVRPSGYRPWNPANVHRHRLRPRNRLPGGAQSAASRRIASTTNPGSSRHPEPRADLRPARSPSRHARNPARACRHARRISSRTSRRATGFGQRRDGIRANLDCRRPVRITQPSAPVCAIFALPPALLFARQIRQMRQRPGDLRIPFPRKLRQQARAGSGSARTGSPDCSSPPATRSRGAQELLDLQRGVTSIRRPDQAFARSPEEFPPGPPVPIRAASGTAPSPPDRREYGPVATRSALPSPNQPLRKTPAGPAARSVPDCRRPSPTRASAR